MLSPVQLGVLLLIATHAVAQVDTGPPSILPAFDPPSNVTTTETQGNTVFTTLTAVPITSISISEGSVFTVTTLTTSTLTVTSCKIGCSYPVVVTPTYTSVQVTSSSIPVVSLPVPVVFASNPITYITVPTISASQPVTFTAVTTVNASVPILYIPVPPPTASPTTFTVTETSTFTTFVPCSTAISTIAGNTFYSTWLTVSYSETTTVATRTTFTTITPAPTAPAAIVCPAEAVCLTVTAPAETMTVTSTFTLPPSGLPYAPGGNFTWIIPTPASEPAAGPTAGPTAVGPTEPPIALSTGVAASTAA